MLIVVRSVLLMRRILRVILLLKSLLLLARAQPQIAGHAAKPALFTFSAGVLLRRTLIRGPLILDHHRGSARIRGNDTNRSGRQNLNRRQRPLRQSLRGVLNAKSISWRAVHSAVRGLSITGVGSSRSCGARLGLRLRLRLRLRL